MYKCKQCGKEFPIPAWMKIPFTPPVPVVNPPTHEVKKPCCPHCYSPDIEEVAVKTT